MRLGWVMIMILGGLMPLMSGGAESLRLVYFKNCDKLNCLQLYWSVTIGCTHVVMFASNNHSQERFAEYYFHGDHV